MLTSEDSCEQSVHGRYFEAVMAGSIPIIEHHLHAGRTAEERALGYHYLLVANLPPPPSRATGAPPPLLVPYCRERALTNRARFLKRQTAHGGLRGRSNVVPFTYTIPACAASVAMPLLPCPRSTVRPLQILQAL